MSNWKGHNAIVKEILTERAMRYHRNVIVAGIMLFTYYFLSAYIDISKSQLLGDMFVGEGQDKVSLVVLMTWLFLIYNKVPFDIYATRDFRTWLGDACHVDRTNGRPKIGYTGYPQLQMYFGLMPLNLGWPFGDLDQRTEFLGWERKTENGTFQYAVKYRNQNHAEGELNSTNAFLVPRFERRLIMWKAGWFVTYEIGLVVILVAAAALGEVLKPTALPFIVSQL